MVQATNSQSGPSKINKSKFLAAIAVTGLAIVGALIAANHYLNPLTFSQGEKAAVAKVLSTNRSFAVYDPNFDFRGLRREQIKNMKDAPEVVIFAGSRFEVATEKSFPGKKFYNAFVHNDYFEDMLAIVQLLDESNKLPKMLVMSVRHISFVPIPNRETEEWKMFAPEYRKMAAHLDIQQASLADTTPYRHYLGYVSLDLASHGLQQKFKKTSVRYGPTDSIQLADMDVIHPDGSMSFSKSHIGTYTPESARTDSLKRAAEAVKKPGAKMTDEDLAAFGKLLDFLNSKGVQVAIAITPHHPTFWNAIAAVPYGKSLVEMERVVTDLTTKHKAVTVGSFNPAIAGCKEASFRDYIHLDEACLKTIFDQIKPAAS